MPASGGDGVSPIGNKTVSLWAMLTTVATTLVSLLVAMWVGSLVETRLMAAPGLDRNVRVVLGRIARAVLILVALLTALGMSGIDLTVLSVFGGALGVGLGLGLQRIASNYVCGFVLLLDRSLRIGDLITVAGSVDRYYGTVTQISTRYTLLRAMDGTESVIPNEMLVSGPVVNHSLSDPRVMLAVKVAVAYESDLELALQLSEHAAGSAAAGVRRRWPAAGNHVLDRRSAARAAERAVRCGNCRVQAILRERYYNSIPTPRHQDRFPCGALGPAPLTPVSMSRRSAEIARLSGPVLAGLVSTMFLYRSKRRIEQAPNQAAGAAGLIGRVFQGVR